MVYPEAEQLVKIYRDILQDHEVIPVFVIRNYNDFIISAYKWLLKDKEIPVKLSKFAEELELNTPRWSQIIEALFQTFTSPIIWTFEDYKNNANKILCDLINQISHQKISCDNLKTYDKKRNPAAGENFIKLHYTVNRWLGPKVRKRAKYRINRHFGQSDIFFGKLLTDPMDISLKNRFDSTPLYEKEIADIKSNPNYIVLPSS